MDLSFLPRYWAYFNYGVLVTIMISASVVFFGTIIGVLVTLIKRTQIKPLTWLVNTYVWIFSWDTNGRSNYDCLCLDAF